MTSSRHDDHRTIGVVSPTGQEVRVGLVPQDVAPLREAGFEVLVSRGAGLASGIPDEAYVHRGAVLVDDHTARGASIVVQVALAEGGGWGRGSAVVGLADPHRAPVTVESLRAAEVSAFALDLMPRTTKAQSMDVLSSQAALAGYKAALLAASALDRVLPMMSTAAGTLPPSRVLVIGAGVAGLQAAATARRLGARVTAYDVRREAREQVASVGADFLDIDVESAAGRDGYATELSQDLQRRQQELLSDAVAESDAVICTALVPGRPAPVVITTAMVARMRVGGVVVDLADSHGGNCELTRRSSTVDHGGVVVIGASDLIGDVAADASRLFSRNVANFVRHLAAEGALEDPEGASDEIVRRTLLVSAGRVVHPDLVPAAETVGVPA